MEILISINFVSARSILAVSIFGLPLKKLYFSISNVVLLMTSDGKLPKAKTDNMNMMKGDAPPKKPWGVSWTAWICWIAWRGSTESKILLPGQRVIFVQASVWYISSSRCGGDWIIAEMLVIESLVMVLLRGEPCANGDRRRQRWFERFWKVQRHPRHSSWVFHRRRIFRELDFSDPQCGDCWYSSSP